MQTKRLTEDLLVSPQLTVTDVATAAALGIRSIINNRPDGQEPDQPSSAEIAAAAEAAGLGYRQIPVLAGLILDEHVEAFSAAVSELNAPVLAFCRTGSCPVILWALLAAKDKPVSDVLSIIRIAGYRLIGLEARIGARHQTSGAALTRRSP